MMSGRGIAEVLHAICGRYTEKGIASTPLLPKHTVLHKPTAPAYSSSFMASAWK